MTTQRSNWQFIFDRVALAVIVTVIVNPYPFSWRRFKDTLKSEWRKIDAAWDELV